MNVSLTLALAHCSEPKREKVSTDNRKTRTSASTPPALLDSMSGNAPSKDASQSKRQGNSQWIVHATRIYQATTLKNPSSKHARPNCVSRQRAIDEHVTQTQQTKTLKKSRPLHNSNCATYSGRPNNSHAVFNQRIPSNIVSHRGPW